MRLFNRGAPTTILPSGYKPDLDRLPPQPGSGCVRTLMLIVAFFAIVGGIIFAVVSIVNASRQPAILELTPVPTRAVTQTETVHAAPTSSPTSTLDNWSLTGTALIFATASATPTASPTQDFCGFLTPTATASPTLPYTPDAWMKTGTAVFYLTSTATPHLDPTATTPRSWCDVKTATLTPFPLRGSTTETPGASVLPPTSTLVPPSSTPRPQIPPMQPTSAPLILPTDAPPVYVPPTLPPPPTTASTRRPTRTPTETATTTMTSSATLTNTPSATDAPNFNIYQADCTPGYPSFGVQNIGAPLGAYVLWDIKTSDGLSAVTGFWLEDMLLPDGLVSAAAPAWINVPGMYILTIYQPWDTMMPAQSAVATCTAPVTETPTATITPTNMLPELTQEIVPTIPSEATIEG